jgi:hypothetical protein
LRCLLEGQINIGEGNVGAEPLTGTAFDVGERVAELGHQAQYNTRAGLLGYFALLVPGRHTRKERAAPSEDTDDFPLDLWTQHQMQAPASAISLLGQPDGLTL